MKLNKFKYWLGLFLTTIFIISCSGAATAAKDKETGKMVLVIMDRITLTNFLESNTPNIKKLINEGSLGLMNTNVAPGAERNSESTYGTIGAGSRLNGLALGQAFNIEEEYQGNIVKDIFFRRTGLKVTENNVVNIGLPQAIKNNKELKYIAVPGTLGQILKDNGLASAVIGNSDINIEPFYRRQVASIAMNSQGVTNGVVDSRVNTISPQAPMGIAANYQALWKFYQELKNNNDLIVIDLGDTARVDEGASFTLDERVKEQMKEAFTRGDEFIGKLTKDLDLNKDQIIILSPTPSQEAAKAKSTLTPVVYAGKGISHGILTSDTTKRTGIITNIDITSSVLDYFKIKVPSQVVGRSVESVAQANVEEFLQNLEEKTVLTSTIRNGLITAFVTIEGIVFILGAILLYKKRELGRRLLPFLVFLLSIPCSFYLLPALNPQSIISAVMEVFLLTLGITAVALGVGRKNIIDPYIIVSFITVVTILGDLYTGTNLGTSAVMSYDPLVGARFYGLGNEYFGVFFGSAVICIMGLIQRFNLGNAAKYLAIPFFVIVTYTISAPNLGADAGGAISALAGFISTLLFLYDIKINKKIIFAVFGSIFLIVGAFVLFDLSRSPETQTHIGRTINLIINNGSGALIDIVVRKVGVNIKLINYSHWSRDYVLPLAVLLWILYGPLKLTTTLKREYKVLLNGVTGILVGSIFALVVNDSGIVAAATTIIYGAVPLLALALNESSKENVL